MELVAALWTEGKYVTKNSETSFVLCLTAARS